MALHSSSCAILPFREQPIRVRAFWVWGQESQGRGVKKSRAGNTGTEVSGEEGEEKAGAVQAWQWACVTPHVDAVDADGST